MDINWFGQACFRLKGKNTTVIIDPFNPDFTGLKLPKDLQAQVLLITHSHADHNFAEAVKGNPLIVNGPGEYEIAGVSVTGILTYHDNVSGSERGVNTVYHILIDGIHVVHLGDIGHLLTEEQISQIDAADILLVPVGDKFTLNAEKAAKVVTQLEAKIVIPMHYNLPGLKFELDIVEPFLKEMGAEGVSPVPKLSINKEKLPEETTVVVLNKG